MKGCVPFLQYEQSSEITKSGFLRRSLLKLTNCAQEYEALAVEAPTFSSEARVCHSLLLLGRSYLEGHWSANLRRFLLRKVQQSELGYQHH